MNSVWCPIYAANFCFLSVYHLTVVCLVAWPLNESEAGVDLVYAVLMLIKGIYIRKAVRSLSKQSQLQPHYHSKARQLSTQL